jgi:hypothetical protein
MLSKLEALLARVVARSTERRATASDQDTDKPTIPPAAPVAPLRASLDEPDVDIAPAVEVVVDNGPDIVIGEAVAADEALLDEVSDSRERLVAAEPVRAPATSVIAEVEEDDDLPEDEAKEDEAPASSRRPVAPAPEERLAELAFGSEEPPAAGRTPPPKSGPLPAPPLDFDSDVTGVRKSVPPPDDAPPLARLTPHVARLQVADARDPIVDVIGEAQRFAPPTFNSLLDASLSL